MPNTTPKTTTYKCYQLRKVLRSSIGLSFAVHIRKSMFLGWSAADSFLWPQPLLTNPYDNVDNVHISIRNDGLTYHDYFDKYGADK